MGSSQVFVQNSTVHLGVPPDTAGSGSGHRAIKEKTGRYFVISQGPASGRLT
jgi:hypothetical protein